MKKFIFYLILLLGITGDYSFGQCLTNGNLANACSSVIYYGGVCPTWTNACGNGWVRSHGTPQILQYTGSSSAGSFTEYYAYLESFIQNGDTAGDGMYTPFAFQQNTWYDVKIDFNTQLPAGVTPTTQQGYGWVLCYAASGLTQHTLDNCYEAVPEGGGVITQEIGNYLGLTPTPIVPGGINATTFTFKAALPYTQFWIYPYSSSYYRYNMELYRVEICPSCTAIADYPDGVLPTVMGGATVTIGGGPTGSEAIQVLPSLMTTVTASQAIYLKPGFKASSTGSGGFTASIVPCGTNGSTIIPEDYFDSLAVVSANPPGFDSTAISNGLQAGQAALPAWPDSLSGSKLQIYPTVSSGVFTITGTPANLGNAIIIVADESGRIVYNMYNSTNTTISLDLGSLASGLYFVQIRQSTKAATMKIIINK
jgi:hypothetical protein